MGKRILFSPIGGTDPISQNNFHDGSMLHIIRCYKPDIVYLYMSKEMLAYQEEDDRYRYCISKLDELQNRKTEVVEIERPNLEDVQEFNFFYNEFREILTDIFKKKNDDDEVLINISSGTPAMKSGLLVLKTIGELPCTAIQVSTPVRKMNEHTHKGYDVELAWEGNEDNDLEAFENRCEEVTCPSLSEIKQIELIKKLIRSYDYSAALTTADGLIESKEKAKIIDLLTMANKRLMLDFNVAMVTAKKYKLEDIFPIKSSNEVRMFEYAAGLEIKRKKEEYGDFARALTPIIWKLFTQILAKKYNVDIYRYCNETDTGYRWSQSKLYRTDVYEYLQAGFADKEGGFKGGIVYSIHLVRLMEQLNLHTNEPDGNLISIIEDLRKIEELVRNKAAHDLATITDEYIKKTTGYNCLDIMKFIKRAFTYSGINITTENWDTYDYMNERIIELI